MTNARTAKSAREKSAEMRARAAREEARRRNLLVLSAVLAVLVVVVGAWVIVRSASHEQAVTAAASARPPRNLVDGGILVGDTAATVTITRYEDFQCPACKSFENQNAAQLEKMVSDGTVKILYKPVSILDRASTTQYSTRALTAAAAVVDTSPSAFPAFHKLLFANQPAEGGAGLTDAQLVALATQAGADGAAVQTALSRRSYATWIATATDDFSKAGFTATPTVLVNGTKVEDWTPAKLATAVQQAAS